jgi:hypothetical protein
VSGALRGNFGDIKQSSTVGDWDVQFSDYVS